MHAVAILTPGGLHAKPPGFCHDQSACSLPSCAYMQGVSSCVQLKCCRVHSLSLPSHLHMADPAGGSVLRNQWHRPVEHVSEGQCSLRPKNAIGLKRGADDYKFHKPSKLAARDRKVCATRRPQAAPAGGGRGQGINGSQPDANRAEVVTAGTSNRGCDDAGSGRLPEGCTFLPVDIASLPERLCKVLRLYSELLNDWTVGVQLVSDNHSAIACLQC